MSREGALAKNAAIFAVGNVGSKVLVLLLLPFCTYYIDQAGIGTYDLLYTLLEVLKPVAVLAVPEALFRWLLDKDADRRKVFASWSVLFLALLSVFTVVYWGTWLVFRFADAGLMYSLVVTGVCYLGLQFATRGLHNNKLFAAQGVVYSVAMCSSSLLFVILLGFGYRGMLLGILVGNCAASALMLFSQHRELPLSLKGRDSALLRNMLRYSAFLLPNTLCWWLINGFSRVLVVGALGASANGVFAIASRFPAALTTISGIFQQAWTEQAVGELSSADRDVYFSKIFSLYSKAMTSLVFVLVPATALFIDLALCAEYADANRYMGFLYLSGVFNAFSGFFGTGYFCGKDTKGAASTTVFGSIVSCGFGLATINVIGLYGVTIGMLLGQASLWLVRVRQSKRYFRISIEWKSLLPGLAGCIALALCVPHLGALGSAALLPVCIVAALLYSREFAGLLWRKAHRR
ncbi:MULTISPECIES: lipopolysaccharide biosynthesis protein [unclassified Adlercreutzia]|uniref:lipopolysaccharide biosynthesis protein n=1 Tax=unclassified Adlercreutzia TaxID=2636013 RepID=UPI0013EADD3D|nr:MULTISPECIES: oligosaccharide flippase family protein [unclassified Adlercreutzia]